MVEEEPLKCIAKERGGYFLKNTIELVLGDVVSLSPKTEYIPALFTRLNNEFIKFDILFAGPLVSLLVSSSLGQ